MRMGTSIRSGSFLIVPIYVFIQFSILTHSHIVFVLGYTLLRDKYLQQRRRKIEGGQSTQMRSRGNKNIYKIECVEENVGRIQQLSKKWVTWRFQVVEEVEVKPPTEVVQKVELLASPAPEVPVTLPSHTEMEPLSIPKVQTYCISINWSLITGKQEIEMNGETIWFGRRSGGSIFSHAWVEDDFQLEVLGTCNSPKKHVSPGFRCFDLMINGRTYHELPIWGKTEFTPLATIAAADLPTSIVEILYPNGYTWKPSEMDVRFERGRRNPRIC